MRISDWSSDVCSSDLHLGRGADVVAVLDAVLAGDQVERVVVERQRLRGDARMEVQGLAARCWLRRYPGRRDLREVDGIDAGHAGGAASAVRAGQLRDRAVAGGDVEHAPPAAERSEAVEPEAPDAAGVVAAERAGQRMQVVLTPVPPTCSLPMAVVGGRVRTRPRNQGKKTKARMTPQLVNV